MSERKRLNPQSEAADSLHSGVMEGGLAALQPAAPGVRALCHLLMSSQGEAGPNPSLSQGTETGPCPVAKGSYSHEHSSHRLIVMLHYSNCNIKMYAMGFFLNAEQEAVS